MDLTIVKSTGPEKERENLANFSPNRGEGHGTEVHSQNAKTPAFARVFVIRQREFAVVYWSG